MGAVRFFFSSEPTWLITCALRQGPFGGEGEDLSRMTGGGLVALHSSGSRPAFVSVAGASNPAVRIGPDKMFG